MGTWQQSVCGVVVVVVVGVGGGGGGGGRVEGRQSGGVVAQLARDVCPGWAAADTR